MSLEGLIALVIEAKQGNKEFALFYINDGWEAHSGCPSLSVMLGEVGGEFIAKGATPEAAVAALLAAVDKGQTS